MAQLYSYLTFNGNCREAMKFYQNCLGGELSIQTVGDSPKTKSLPAKMKESVLHAVLQSGGLTLLASDMVGEYGLVKGNSVSLMLECGSLKELKSAFGKLAEGGKIAYPIEVTFWGASLGGLIDKYGHHWLLHFEGGEPDTIEPATHPVNEEFMA